MNDKEKLERLLDEFEMFAHTTSHDLRDPLRQALIDCDELKTMKLGEKADLLIKNVISEVNLVINKVAYLREYSYLVNGKKVNEQVNFDTIILEILEQLKEKIAERDAEITCTKLPILKGNKEHLKQLFYNLIDNAIKFNDSDKPLVTISASEKNNLWQFEIKDNGVGLDKVYRRLVFSIFQRLNPDEENDSLGTGLTFCKKIAQNHGGDLWFESDGENGTSFFVTIAK